MRKVRQTTPPSETVSSDVTSSVGRWAFRQYSVAFALMSLIPLLITVYILAVKLFTLSVFEGIVGLCFFIAVAIALLGFLVGQQILKSIMTKLINTSAQLRQHELIKSAFVANVAYELRPPLAAIQMSLQNIFDGLLGPLTDPQVNTIKNCNGVVERLVRLVTDLIAVTDVQAKRSTLQQGVFELQTLLHEAVRISKPYLDASHLQAAVTCPEQQVMLFGDQARLLQAFGSLIDHAVRWSPEGSVISVELHAVLEGWQVIVSHRTSARRAELAQTFESLRKLGVTEEKYLGLGLHLVKEIVDLHYGRFWVEEIAGENTRLIINLPSLEHQ